MHFDNLQITIRERTCLDLMDLGLQVFRAHGPRFLLAFACGAIPLQLLNHLSFHHLAEIDYEERSLTSDEAWQLVGFVLCTAQSIFIQSQLAGVFATRYLGSVLFQDEPRMRSVLSQVGRSWFRLLWCQALMRGVVIAGLLAWWSRVSNWAFSYLALLTCLIMFLRALRPFLNEVVLLEDNPLLATPSNQLTIARRSKRLHAPSSMMLVGRWLCTSLIGSALVVSVLGVFLFVSGVFFHDWIPSPQLVKFAVPLAMWGVAAYLTVVRFLTYLDLRIRDEGWEVELRMRAEASRLLEATRALPHARTVPGLPGLNRSS
ncbi:MAG: hypothetical protein CMJ59_09260 [Planctomycetaceae bacterium]|nr:hypothetical protein [Planctomycetaceae bacterium]